MGEVPHVCGSYTHGTNHGRTRSMPSEQVRFTVADAGSNLHPHQIPKYLPDPLQLTLQYSYLIFCFFFVIIMH